MKYLLIFISIFIIYFIPVRIFAADEGPTNRVVNVNVLFGQMGISGTNYNTLRLEPEFNFEEVSLGLMMNYDFDINNSFVSTEWNSWQALLTKVKFSFGKQDDPVYIRIGGLENFTLGDGFIFDNFTSMLNYPAVNINGVTMDLKFHYFGIDAMADNILLWDIMGIRAYMRPFTDMNGSVISNFEIGLTFGDDLNNRNMFPPSGMPYAFSYNTGTQMSTMVYGADIGTLLNADPDFIIKAYADIAHIQNMGSGETAGFKGIIAGTIPFNVALRVLQPSFLPEYFDIFYETSRSYKYQNLGNLSNINAGWIGSTGLDFVSNSVTINFQYESYFSGEINPSFLVSFEMTKDFLKLIGLKFSYLRQNFVNINDFYINDDGNSSFIFTLDFYILDTLKMSADFRENYELLSSGMVYPYSYVLVSTSITF
jgi:hypothetical protein